MPQQPQLIVIGGPNGAGKTTFAREYLANEGNCLRFLNTDEIARGLSPLDTSLSQQKAGRLLIEEVHRLIEAKQSFALESTLSGKAQAKWIEAAAANGFSVHLHYLWLPSAEESHQRVQQRVREGGHDVRRQDIDRRFPRSLANFHEVYRPLADECCLWDASVIPPTCLERSQPNRLMEEDIKALIDKDWSTHPRLPESEMPDWLLGAKRAMDRATEKELDRKRKLGHKIVIWKDGKVQIVDP
jgi:predicted ABC-type ATPase